MQKTMKILAATVLVVLCVESAQAGVVSWTDWTSATTDPYQVLGNLTVGTSNVDVTFSGVYGFAQTIGGTNYWTPDTYTSPDVDNSPPASDIIGLYGGGTKTISFSQAIQDPLIALVSWNGNTVDFGVPIEVLSYGRGYFGTGTPEVNPEGTGFYGNGEVHGVIRLPGSYSSITFTDTYELWHGFTIGVAGLAEVPPAVPVPGAILLGMIGTGVVGALRRKFA